jgi:D-glycero-alpha-D-manno-heptose-7-phosphate kinase
MIISRTPFRVSFFGGGTDYPAWYEKHGGAVLSTAIDKYCYLTCRYLPPFFEHRYRILYSVIETVREVGEIRHPAVRGALQKLGIQRGLEIHHDGDLPARSGMGSSSSFAVGILHVLHALEGRMCSKEQLAREAIDLEQNVLRETVGAQDQIAASFGGFNCIRFSLNGNFSVNPVFLPPVRMKDFQSHLMLFFTGLSRVASDVAAQVVASLEEREATMHRMAAMVDEALEILRQGSLEDFGHLMDQAWNLKRTLHPAVSTPLIDSAYQKAREAGALGGKILGAGGGGFLLLFVPPKRRRHVQNALANFLHVPFEFEPLGSQIIVYDPEQDYSHLDQFSK